MLFGYVGVDEYTRHPHDPVIVSAAQEFCGNANQLCRRIRGMEPRIRFAKTVDGGAVAFWAQGDGPTLLHLPWLPWGHAQLECLDAEMGLWYERVSSICRLVRYDGRGSGLSDWEAPNYGVETQIKDMEAVIDSLELDRFGLLASLNMGPAAITLAARYPDRVTCLILWCTLLYSAEFEEDSLTVHAGLGTKISVSDNWYVRLSSRARHFEKREDKETDTESTLSVGFVWGK